MSRFFSSKYSNLEAYVPGEQPKDMKYIKLNTNESPFPPSVEAQEAARYEAGILQLYSDPECTELVKKAADVFGIDKNQILMTNGSDEILNFAFMAFCDKDHPIAFADITYGFYSVFAEVNNIPYKIIPLKDDFTIDYKDYLNIGMNIVIANPNAPTGIALPLWQIEEIVRTNPDHVVVIDEAYVDFGAESAKVLLDKYDNLLVIQTFSKSRSLAGGRLGFGMGNSALIQDLNTIKYSTNPYNINRMTMAVGCAVLDSNDYYMNNCRIIMENREYTVSALEGLGFSVLPSSTNFVFAKHSSVSGEAIYSELRKRGILVRHFTKEKIKDYNRITVGTREQMDAFISAVSEIIKEK